MALSVTDMTELDLEQLTNLFGLLSDKTRLNILLLLSAGERNVTSLCNELRLPQPTVSHHLGLLRLSNVIVNRRSGKQVFYQLNSDHQPFLDSLMDLRTDLFQVRVHRAVSS